MKKPIIKSEKDHYQTIIKEVIKELERAETDLHLTINKTVQILKKMV